MPQLTVDLSIHKVVEIIPSYTFMQAMNPQEIKTLYLLLTQDGKELVERKQDIELKRVKFLTRDEVFDVSG